MNIRILMPCTLVLVALHAHAADITGAGSTFAAPIYAKWADAYKKAGGGKVNYQGIGSSGGLKQINAKTVDFAGSDAPLKDDEPRRQACSSSRRWSVAWCRSSTCRA